MQLRTLTRNYFLLQCHSYTRCSYPVTHKDDLECLLVCFYYKCILFFYNWASLQELFVFLHLIQTAYISLIVVIIEITIFFNIIVRMKVHQLVLLYLCLLFTTNSSSQKYSQPIFLQLFSSWGQMEMYVPSFNAMWVFSIFS